MLNRASQATASKDPLESSAQFVKGVGPRRYELLKRAGIRTVRDLLFYFPRRHEDRSEIRHIADLQPGTSGAILARVVSCKLKKRDYRRSVLTVGAVDETGAVELIWFNQPYFEVRFKEGGLFLFSGKLSERFDRLQMAAPYFEKISEAGKARTFADPIVPIYPLTEELNQALLRRVIRSAIDGFAKYLEEVFPPKFRKSRRLPTISDAVRDMHFPRSLARVKLARRRLAYEELFLLEVAMALRYVRLKQVGGAVPIDVSEKVDAHIRRLFPFRFTRAQDKVVEEIRADLASPHPMSRLLQGDVGSGKTVIAVYALLGAVAAGHQAAMMAPTEVLAEQHYLGLRGYLRAARVKLALLRGGGPASKRKEMLEQIAEGKIDIVVGTHALVQKQVRFQKLALVVIDEQHKFGVLQRAALSAKGIHPHCLVMTATPIPRTLTLTVFGDLDFSVLDELPPGRKPVSTVWVQENDRPKTYDFIRKQMQRGRQAFVVYPLLAESPRLELKSATKMAEYLDREVFPDFKVGLLHGRMPALRKQQVMGQFRSGRLHMLVATVVVEVGIDVPNANLMVIEHADRFGMSQLHQLRGRIGRGAHRSYCMLFADPKTEEARRRLEVICRTSDGFRIAEEDLRLRGPGEFFGTRQHGLPELAIADIARDYELLKLARRDAFRIVRQDPALEGRTRRKLRQAVIKKFGQRLELVSIG